jgi:hypothetical protein
MYAWLEEMKAAQERMETKMDTNQEKTDADLKDMKVG